MAYFSVHPQTPLKADNVPCKSEILSEELLLYIRRLIAFFIKLSLEAKDPSQFDIGRNPQIIPNIARLRTTDFVELSNQHGSTLREHMDPVHATNSPTSLPFDQTSSSEKNESQIPQEISTTTGPRFTESLTADNRNQEQYAEQIYGHGAGEEDTWRDGSDASVVSLGREIKPIDLGFVLHVAYNMSCRAGMLRHASHLTESVEIDRNSTFNHVCNEKCHFSLPNEHTEYTAHGEYILELWELLITASRQPLHLLEHHIKSGDRQPTRLPFLHLPAEIRNDIYKYLLPTHTLVESSVGLLQTCKQVEKEFSSLVLTQARKSLAKTERDSMQLRISTCNSCHDCKPASYISIPSVLNISQLRNVHVSMGMGYSEPGYPWEPPRIIQGHRPVSFTEAFADLQALLSLHLPFVTITVPVRCDGSSFQQNAVRFSCAYTCFRAFKCLEKNCTINTRNIVFDLSCNLSGSRSEASYRPYIAFTAQQLRKTKGTKFEFLGQDSRTVFPTTPRLEDEPDGYGHLKEQNRLAQREILNQRLDGILRRGAVITSHSKYAMDEVSSLGAHWMR
jgi:hypothetical protein